MTRLVRQAPARSLADIAEQLRQAFLLVQQCVAEQTPVVLCVDGPALLGQSSVEDAAVATGLVGLARAVGLEGAAKGWQVAAVAVDPGAEPDAELVRLATLPGLCGQVINASAGALGKVIP